MQLRIALVGLLMAGVALAADVAGTWTVQVVLDAGTGTATFTFKQEGETLSGTYTGTFGDAPLRGTAKGDQVEWSFNGGQAGTVTFKGKLEGTAKMTGTAQYGELGSGTFSAQKK